MLVEKSKSMNLLLPILINISLLPIVLDFFESLENRVDFVSRDDLDLVVEVVNFLFNLERMILTYHAFDVNSSNPTKIATSRSIKT